MGVGLGLLFGIVAVLAALVTTVTAYQYAIRHAQELGTGSLQLTSGIGFGVAMLAASLCLVAIHVYDS